ncbi:fatty acid cis/trans isomerase [Motilimonas pumila]|uniref:9-hexadecenoic acid cis-trans isomerase n=1 Tax=Motilimonas pumila TaxID=2303987 RepID=A0A418YKN3_9GAMM|nr:fatty acid cis/trans isomerase [Motilimonas pumila]RJG51545.1 hypothetical protein D1Z90_02095 [Motilimonas pumila]
MFKFVIASCLLLLLSGCSTFRNTNFDAIYGPAAVQDRLVDNTTAAAAFYHDSVQPILNQRCVVCHGCYDAPCQLKLTSPEGIDRGTSKVKVFNGTRLLAEAPSRLYQDAFSTASWREKGFNSVLNEREQSPSANLAASVLYQALQLKQAHPNLDTREHAQAFDFSLDRNQQCSSIEEYGHFAKQNPYAGMPYGLPAISEQQFNTLEIWLAQGAKMAAPTPLQLGLIAEIDLWEHWLNRDSLKSQLVSRYIYEHLFLAHLHFNAWPGQYFYLVRSKTPPGQPVERITTLRPYDDPLVDRVYYRLVQERETILAKTHMPYALNSERLDTFNQLFFTPHYEVNQLPSYEVSIAANPFIAFADIPVSSRYDFLRMEAQNTIMAFIKGPVCRGQIALNVIYDHFWVFFSEGNWEKSEGLGAFLVQQKEHLRLPSESASNSSILTSWLTYSKAQQKYLSAKQRHLQQALDTEYVNRLNLSLVWDGEHSNDNAALTVFRHFDNASVVKGLIGQKPKTAWLIDYPILERIHYLLVAGFDVYGNLGHQLNTRLYMDFLRMESEFNFLALLPTQSRQQERDFWYRDVNKDIRQYIEAEQHRFQYPTGIHYQTEHHKSELFDLLKQHLAGALNQQYDFVKDDAPTQEIRSLRGLQNLNSQAVNLLPEVSVLAIQDGSNQRVYTLLRNTAYSNMSSLLRDANYRMPKEDNLTIVRGVIGDYPNLYLSINAKQITAFARTFHQMEQEQDYRLMLDQYGIRRSDPRFWAFSDNILTHIKQQSPVTGGLLDYNRLENR